MRLARNVPEDVTITILYYFYGKDSYFSFRQDDDEF